MKFSYTLEGKIYAIEIDQISSGYQVIVGGKKYEVKKLRQSGSTSSAVLLLEIGGLVTNVHAAVEDNLRWVHFRGTTYVLEKSALTQGGQKGKRFPGKALRAPMPGQIREVYVGVGDSVERGQTLVLLEAMKMEMSIQSPRDGKVRELSIEVGDSVEKDQILVEVE